MDVARVQDRGKNTLIPSSEVRKHDSEVLHWKHIKMSDTLLCARSRWSD